MSEGQGFAREVTKKNLDEFAVLRAAEPPQCAFLRHIHPGRVVLLGLQ